MSTAAEIGEKLIRQIREAIAEDNRKEIIERLLKGRQERVRKGHSAGGNVPYGYRRERKTLVLNELEAVVVGTILEVRQHGRSVPEIAELLNREGYEPQKWQAVGPSEKAKMSVAFCDPVVPFK